MQLSYKKNPEKLQYLENTKKIFIDLCNNNVKDEDINYKDIIGGTPLAWAAILGKDELVVNLINRGANPNVKVFPLLYQVMKIDWILEPALIVITKILPSHLKQFIKKENIIKAFKTLKEHSYINEDGVYIKYIVNILYETTKYDCFIKSMLERWKTQEDFDRKVRLSFWLYPKIVDQNNYFIHKFYKDSIIASTLRLNFVNKFSNNPSISYTKINTLIPLNKHAIDKFLNEAWNKIIIPDMVHNIMVRVICNDKIN
jgi:ankyrin repeat protein